MFFLLLFCSVMIKNIIFMFRPVSTAFFGKKKLTKIMHKQAVYVFFVALKWREHLNYTRKNFVISVLYTFYQSYLEKLFFGF